MNCKIIGLLLVIICPIIEIVAFKLAKRTVDGSKGEFIAISPTQLIFCNLILCVPIAMFLLFDLKMDDIIAGIVGAIFIAALNGSVYDRFTNDRIKSIMLGKTLKEVKLSNIKGYYLDKNSIKVMTESDTFSSYVYRHSTDAENLMKAHNISLHPIYEPVEVYNVTFYLAVLYIALISIAISTPIAVFSNKTVGAIISTSGLIIVLVNIFTFSCAIKIDEDILTYHHLFKKSKSIPLCDIASCTLKKNGILHEITTVNGDTIKMPYYNDTYNLVNRFIKEDNWIVAKIILIECIGGV